MQGKSSYYKEEFHSITLFNKGNEKLLAELITYSLQDSNCLYECIEKLQEIYLLNYNVDITSVLSTSALSMKIFRTNFLNLNIPIFLLFF